MDDDPVAALLAAARAAPKQDGTRQVIGWVSFSSVETRDYTNVAPTWGGDMKKGEGWSDYFTPINPEYRSYCEALRAAIMQLGLRRGGDWHQWAENGVPVFDDGAIATFTFRGWGDLMAAIWAEADGHRFGYMDYYMDSCLEDAGIKLSPPID